MKKVKKYITFLNPLKRTLKVGSNVFVLNATLRIPIQAFLTRKKKVTIQITRPM